MTTTALTTVIALAGTPTWYIEVIVAWITSAPRTLPSKENRPPTPRTVPPMTTARMASSSVYRPITLASEVLMLETAMRPATPAQSAQNTYANSLTRFSLMPAKRLARELMPTDSTNRPERGPAQQQPRSEEDRQHDEERERQEEDEAVAEECEGVVEDVDLDGVRAQLRDAAAGDHEDQRRHHRLDPHVGHQDAVPEPAQQGCQHRHHDHDRQRREAVGRYRPRPR